jgi:alpha-tubulin suppressor-like RCC1 family protein
MKSGLLGWGNVAGYVEGKTTGYYPQIQVATPSLKFDGEVTSLSSAYEALFVTLANNTIWAVGSNTAGQLGTGNSNTATQFGFSQMTFWRNVTLQTIFPSQSKQVCATSANFSLFCWGQNTYGQLGVGDTRAHFQLGYLTSTPTAYMSTRSHTGIVTQ